MQQQKVRNLLELIQATLIQTEGVRKDLVRIWIRRERKVDNGRVDHRIRQVATQPVRLIREAFLRGREVISLMSQEGQVHLWDSPLEET